MRLGVVREYLEDSLYQNAVNQIRDLGATLIEFEAGEGDFDGFLDLLSGDMKKDLPTYLHVYRKKL